jgi:hypothetical protein
MFWIKWLTETVVDWERREIRSKWWERIDTTFGTVEGVNNRRLYVKIDLKCK